MWGSVMFSRWRKQLMLGGLVICNREGSTRESCDWNLEMERTQLSSYCIYWCPRCRAVCMGQRWPFHILRGLVTRRGRSYSTVRNIRISSETSQCSPPILQLLNKLRQIKSWPGLHCYWDSKTSFFFWSYVLSSIQTGRKHEKRSGSREWRS